MTRLDQKFPCLRPGRERGEGTGVALLADRAGVEEPGYRGDGGGQTRDDAGDLCFCAGFDFSVFWGDT